MSYQDILNGDNSTIDSTVKDWKTQIEIDFRQRCKELNDMFEKWIKDVQRWTL